MRSLDCEARQCLLWKPWPEMRLLTLPMATRGPARAGQGGRLVWPWQRGAVLARPGHCGHSKSLAEPGRTRTWKETQGSGQCGPGRSPRAAAATRREPFGLLGLGSGGMCASLRSSCDLSLTALVDCRPRAGVWPQLAFTTTLGWIPVCVSQQKLSPVSATRPSILPLSPTHYTFTSDLLPEGSVLSAGIR